MDYVNIFNAVRRRQVSVDVAHKQQVELHASFDVDVFVFSLSHLFRLQNLLANCRDFPFDPA